MQLRLSEGISKYQQLKKKSAATVLNTMLPSAHIPSVIVVFVILVFKV
jgi:hypothetical protein